MGAADVVSIEYFEDEERYADLINVIAFDGRQVVSASDVQEKNRVITRIQKRLGTRKIHKIERDIIRSVRLGTKVFFVASELQTHIHYAMPVRVFNEDAAGYLEQWKKRQRQHRKKKDVGGAEFLSGFSAQDRLVPQITLVLYFGEEEWDGPRSLKDMLDLDGLPEPLKKLVADYPLYLVEVRKFPHFDRFRTDIRYVFGFLANASDEEGLAGFVNDHRDFFSNVSEDAYDMISEMSGAEQLKRLSREEYRTETGGINMCKGLQGMLDDSRKEGRKEGREEGIFLAKTVIHLSGKGASTEDIARKCGITEKEVEKILAD